MKILITGGAGFIGTRLAYYILRNFEDVKIFSIDNMSYGNKDNFIVKDTNILEDERFTFIEGDAADGKLIEDIIKDGIDYIYHLAGIAPLPDNQLNKIKSMHCNIKTTLVILDAMQRYGAKRFIFAGSNSIYENICNKILTEDIDLYTTLFYPTTKLISENIIRSFSNTYNMPCIIFRFANVYGEGMDCLRKYPPVTAAFIKKLFYNESPIVYGNGKQHRDFIYVWDLIDLLFKPMFIPTKNKFEIINAGTNTSYTVEYQLSLIKKYMGKENIPTKYINSKDFWKEMPEIYNGTYKISEEVLDKEVQKCSLMSYEKAKEIYSWHPAHSFEEGIELTVKDVIKYLGEKEKNKNEDSNRKGEL